MPSKVLHRTARSGMSQPTAEASKGAFVPMEATGRDDATVRSLMNTACKSQRVSVKAQRDVAKRLFHIVGMEAIDRDDIPSGGS